jgi:hypothetical protein
VNVLEFSPDGRTLITGCHDWRTRLWDTVRGELIAPSLDTQGVNPIVISPDGAHFVEGVLGGRPVIFPMPSEALPISFWSRLAECATGSRLKEAVGYIPLSASELAALFGALRAEHPARFAWPGENGDWHRFHANRAEARGKAFTAEFHRGFVGR